jgi:hypothetical protein
MLTTPLARPFLASLLIFLSASSLPALAWDSTGHRLSASVALRYLDADTRSSLRALLEQHPRYEPGFSFGDARRDCRCRVQCAA